MVDYGFYATFWGLQEAFTKPTDYMNAEKWAPLVTRLDTVLQVFGSFSGASDASEDSRSKGGDKAVGADGPGEAAGEAAMDVVVDEGDATLEEVYFAKFLTSSKLMTLQLRDGYFRRHVLVQILIFLQAVSTEQKMGPSLSAAQRKQVEALHGRCIELLKAIPPGGARFTAAVLTMLEREEHWIRWKKAGCAPFDKAAAETRAEADGSKRRRLSGLGGVGKKMKLGNAELTRLWNMGGNSLEDIAEKQQDAMPALEDFLKEVHEQADPEAGIEEEYKVKNDKAFCWKALRLMAKKDVSLLSKVSQPSGSLEEAVKFLFKQKETGAATSAEPEGSLGKD